MQEEPEADEPTRHPVRVAVLLFGATSGVYNGPVGKGHITRSRAIQCALSLQTHVLSPMLRAGHTVDAFLSSNLVAEGDTMSASELVDLYRPHLRGWHLPNASITRRF
jgi:hypothetical protein